MTGMLVLLLGVLAAALWRFSVAAREARQQATEERSEGAFVASALQEALAKLRTQERALQERAETSERLSETIVSGLASGLLLVDASKRLRIVNPAGRRLLGLPEVPADAVYTEALAPPEPLARVIEECLLTGTPVTRRLVTVVVPRRENGARPRTSSVTWASRCRRCRAPDGAPQGVICLFTDLTKVVALEEQVRLKDGLALLGELTAGLAHELRNGLATVHGYVRLLDPATLPAPQAGYVTALREETAALNQLVTNFLNFARPVSLTPAAVDVSGVVSRVHDEFAAEAARLGGTLSVGGRFGRVDGDEVLLRQAFSNLCRNAIEACEGHGELPRVRVEGQVDAVVGVPGREGLGQRPGDRPAAHRQDLPALLHDQVDRHRPGARRRPEDRRHPQRPGDRVQPHRGRRGVRSPVAPFRERHSARRCCASSPDRPRRPATPTGSARASKPARQELRRPTLQRWHAAACQARPVRRGA